MKFKKSFKFKTSDGIKQWYLNGKLHRTDGHAHEDVNGNKEWYVNGKSHRLDGSACEYANGYKAWWINSMYLENIKNFLLLFK